MPQELTQKQKDYQEKSRKTQAEIAANKGGGDKVEGGVNVDQMIATRKAEEQKKEDERYSGPNASNVWGYWEWKKKKDAEKKDAESKTSPVVSKALANVTVPPKPSPSATATPSPTASPTATPSPTASPTATPDKKNKR